MFLVEKSADLEMSAKRYGFGDPPRTVIDIESGKGAKLFRGHVALLNTSPLIEDIVGAARRYWLGAPADTPLDEVEILLTGPFQISGVHRWGDSVPVYINGKSIAELFDAGHTG